MLFNHETGSVESLLSITAKNKAGTPGALTIVAPELVIPLNTAEGTAVHTNGAIRYNTTTKRIEFSNGVDTWLSAATASDVSSQVDVTFLRTLLDPVYVDQDASDNEFNTLFDARLTLSAIKTVADSEYVNTSGDTMLNNANLIFSGGTITGLTATPTNATEAASKAYVDSVAAGLDPKESVKVATTAAGTLATSFAAGESVDDYTLVVGDRILIKNQTTASENGIYTVNASGAPTRATDSDGTPANEVSGGNFVFVENNGTINKSTGWVLQGVGNKAVGTDPLSYIQFSAAGTYSAGTGLTLTGTVFSLTTPVSTTLGGTGLSATGAANAVLGVVGAGGSLEYKTIAASTDAGKLGATVDFSAGNIVIGTTAVLAVTASTSTNGLTVSATETAQEVAISVALNSELQALSQISTNGLVVHTAANTWVQKSVTSSGSTLTVTNGDGTGAGNINVDLATITQASSGSFVKVTLDSYGRVIGNTPVTAADLTGGFSAGTGITFGTPVAGVIPVNNDGVLALTVSTVSTSTSGPNSNGTQEDGSTLWTSGIKLGTTTSTTEGKNSVAVATTKNGTFYIQLNSALESLANLSGSGMLSIDTSAGAYVERRMAAGGTEVFASHTSTGDRLVITDADGIDGNPTFDLKAITQGSTGSFLKFTVNGYGQVTSNTAVTSADVGGLLAAGTGIAVTGSTATIALATLTDDTSGTFLKITRDSYGRVQGTTAVVASDITGLVNTTYINTNGDSMDSAANLTFSGGGEVLGLPAIPSGATAAVSKAYVDSISQGLDPKASVKVATTVAGTLATSFANGQTVDGYALVTGDRILIKNQAAASENGIYTVNASGAPTRALDCDSWAEIPSSFVFIEQGTTYGDTGWVCTSDTGGTLGTTAVTWIQFTSAGNYSANTATGLDLDGTVFSITTVPVANGGTGLTADGTANQFLAVQNDGDGLEYKTVSAGTGVSVTLGAGSLEIANTGVVTLANSTGSTGLSIDFTKTGTDVTTLLSGTLAIANGGTGETTASGAINALVPTQTGNSGKVLQTNGTVVSWADASVTITGDTGTTTGLTLSVAGTGNAPTLTLGGTLHVDNGGTGLTAAPANGQLLIGNGTGYTLATLTDGTGISITEAAGSITIANTGVTSVALTAPSIFTVTGSPVTTTGTLDFALNTQVKNLVFAGPATGSDAAPTFRALAYADLPIVNYTETATSLSTITATAVDVVSNDVSFGVASDAKTGLYTGKVSTADATPTPLAIGTLASGSLWTYTVTIAGLNATNQAAYKLEGGVFNNGGTATLICGRKSILAETTGAQAWDVAVSVSGDVLSVTVTGAASTNIKWVATTVTTEVV
jgi:hypothetical protein